MAFCTISLNKEHKILSLKRHLSNHLKKKAENNYVEQDTSEYT